VGDLLHVLPPCGLGQDQVHHLLHQTLTAKLPCERGKERVLSSHMEPGCHIGIITTIIWYVNCHNIISTNYLIKLLDNVVLCDHDVFCQLQT